MHAALRDARQGRACGRESRWKPWQWWVNIAQVDGYFDHCALQNLRIASLGQIDGFHNLGVDSIRIRSFG